MLSKINSAAVLGIEGYRVEIEVDVARGMPAFVVVGLPDAAIREAKDRVRSAIRNSQYNFPSNKITVNLAPADIKKEGPSFDLPLALGLLAATEQLAIDKLSEFIILGELALDGSVRPVKGVLPIAVSLKASGYRKFILPEVNAAEAAIVDDIEVYPVKSLYETMAFLNEEFPIEPFKVDIEKLFADSAKSDLDFADVKGQSCAKRALEIAAAGGHNLIMIGPPGAGKTMLAKRLPSIIPDMTLTEAIEATKIHSVTGLISSGETILAKRPFRSPHHTASDVSIVGGGTIPRPGEVSLAHFGVLFLDELPEFHRNVLEVLRQPLEDGYVMISRAARSAVYPSNFILVCAMNPCPCGFLTDEKKECHCTPVQIQRYLAKISGPLLDRIDIHLEMPAVEYRELSNNGDSVEGSSQIKERVDRVRSLQRERFGREDICNADMSHKDIGQYCLLTEEAGELLETAMEELNLSARAYDKVMKVSRTIADLESSADIKVHHISEAIQYRSLDRNLWA